MNAFCRRGWLVALAAMALLPVRGETLPPTLTPPSPDTPQIHGAKVFGVRPGAPFLFTVAATGQRPMSFSEDDLPRGLKLNSSSGRITGTAPKAGNYHATLYAQNALGETHRDFLIRVGSTICLTPAMGWNSWNCFAGAVSDEKMRAAADAMVKSGLIDHGWTYINIDDFWQVNPKSTDKSLQGRERDRHGNILPNSRFPDMKALAKYIHDRGLKAGLYSSPGSYTCGGCTGSYSHEKRDARQYAAWGFDYLKYDWCTYGDVYKKEDGGKGVDGMIKPYKRMALDLERTGRDIVFSYCQYGMAHVWVWGAQNGGNSWRTGDDIRDTWASMTKNATCQTGLVDYAGPGHWNDPDMLVVGKVGWGPTMHDSNLTPDEQYSHISLWCLQAAPLLIGCDLTQLDPFTLGLLTNDEVIDIDQDSLGRAAHLLDGTSAMHVWARPLENGDMAVGIFNYGDAAASGGVTWDQLGISGARLVHDLWRQTDLGNFDKAFESGPIPPHGVLFVRLMTPKVDLPD